MTVQSGDVLAPCFKTLAERLRLNGYQTIGFCNNPLVGVIDNGLKRGFETFYNYGGAIPSMPARRAGQRPALAPLRKAWERYTQMLRKIAYPIQNAFARSSKVFQAALNPFWVPLWMRVARFKGDTPSSIRDVANFLGQRATTSDGRPFFLFFNLMETHLPYSAPEKFSRAFAPRFWGERKARDFMRAFNAQAVHWITPREAPFSELEAQTLSEMYDAEVAYQDHLLAELIEALDQPGHRDNTLVVFVADHGEMLGEHQLMGHGFGVYQELIHVPLIIRFPGQTGGKCVGQPVSTTRLFHTVLDVVGVEAAETVHGQFVDVKSQSLVREASQSRLSRRTVFCEAYAPEFALGVMRAHKPDLIEPLHCQATHRAAYEGQYKLIDVEGVCSELFSLDADPSERHSVQGGKMRQRGWRIERLAAQLTAFVEKAGSRRPQKWTRASADLDNELVRQRLRDLGYIE
jgi:uncharacterized sulfatase